MSSLPRFFIQSTVLYKKGGSDDSELRHTRRESYSAAPRVDTGTGVERVAPVIAMPETISRAVPRKGESGEADGQQTRTAANAGTGGRRED
jgi:hypothetical protein